MVDLLKMSIFVEFATSRLPMPSFLINLFEMTMLKIITYFLLLLSATGSFGSSLPVIDLLIGTHQIKAEVASTPASQQLGLMYRKSMPDGQGMLFIFNQKAGHCFWMKNTPLALAIAFIDDDGKIVNIEEMPPLTEESFCPKKPVRYALEMNTRWFEKRSINSGKVVAGLPKP